MRLPRMRGRAAAGLVLALAALATTTTIGLAATGSNKITRLEAPDRTVPFGKRLSLAGTVPGDRGTWVRLRFRPSGSDRWHRVRRVHTDRHGRYDAEVRARVNGAFRAVPPRRSRASLPEPVRVRSRTSFHVTKHHTLVGNGVGLTGIVNPGGKRRVKVVVRGPDGALVAESSRASGRFGLRWRPRQTGVYTLRAHSRRNRLARASRSPVRRVTVYRYAGATWYGPGLYGNTMACGGTLTPETLGVAHLSLPCGTRVKLRYGKRAVTVPVVDRGPYGSGAEFDLTYATRERLGFGDVGTVMTTR